MHACACMDSQVDWLRCKGCGQPDGGGVAPRAKVDCSLDAKRREATRRRTKTQSGPVRLAATLPQRGDSQHYNKSVNIMAEDTLVIGRAYA